MAITSLYAPAAFTLSTGSGEVLPVPFQFLDGSHLRVYLDGDLLTYGTDYTTTATSVIMATGAAGNLVQILLDVPFTQLSRYLEGDSLDPDTIEGTFDSVVLMVQTLREAYESAIRLPALDDGDGTLPAKDARKGKVLYFDPVTGEPTAIAASFGAVATESVITEDIATVSAVDVSTLAEGTYAYVRGYWSPDDGGQGFFYLSKGEAPGLANGGTIIATPDPTAYWRRIVTDGRYHPEYYGARKDPAYDDAAAIQAVLDNHGTCHLRDGTYYVGIGSASNRGTCIEISDGQELRGLGQEVTAIKLKDNAEIVTKANPSVGVSIVQNRSFGSVNRHDILVDGIWFDCNGDGNRSANLSGAYTGLDYYGTAERVAISAVGLRGYNNTISNCKFTGFRGGVTMTNPDGVGGATPGVPADEAGKESFVAYISGEPDNTRMRNRIFRCEWTAPARQSIAGSTIGSLVLQREITLAFVGAGDSVSDTTLGAGGEISLCWFHDIDYDPNNATVADRQLCPIQITSGNGRGVQIHHNTFQDVDGAGFYFDYSQLVGLRYHDNYHLRVSKLFAISVYSGSDHWEDNEFFNNHFEHGKYVTLRDATTDMPLWQFNFSTPYRVPSRALRVRDNYFRGFYDAGTTERTMFGYIRIQTAAHFADMQQVEIYNNVHDYAANNLPCRFWNNSGQVTAGVDDQIQFYNNRDQFGREDVLAYSSSSNLTQARWPHPTGMPSLEVRQLIRAECPILQIDEHFTVGQPDSTVPYGGPLNWRFSTSGTGAQVTPIASEAGSQGIIRLEVGTDVGVEKHASVYLPGAIRLSDDPQEMLRMRFRVRAGAMPSAGVVPESAIVLGLVDSTNPTHQTESTVGSNEVPLHITSGIWLLVGSDATRMHRLAIWDGGVRRTLTTLGGNTADWHNVEIQIFGDNEGTARARVFRNGILYAYNGSVPAGVDLFPMIGVGVQDVEALAYNNYADVDLASFQLIRCRLPQLP